MAAVEETKQALSSAASGGWSLAKTFAKYSPYIASVVVATGLYFSPLGVGTSLAGLFKTGATKIAGGTAHAFQYGADAIEHFSDASASVSEVVEKGAETLTKSPSTAPVADMLN